MKRNSAGKMYIRFASYFAICSVALVPVTKSAVAQSRLSKPFALTCDSLRQPLGIDSTKPLFAWKLKDGRTGAKQTAYEIVVSTQPGRTGVLNADVWDSGRIASEQSVNVSYDGKPLAAETRYYWQVRVWGQDGKSYPLSDPDWWETGLMTSGGWKAQWIGYEDRELQSVRQSGATWITNAAAPGFKNPEDTHHDFRLPFALPAPVKRAVLYATGEDTADAWINGKRVMQAQPLSPWQQMPWKTYFSKDVTAELHAGQNNVAIGITHFYTPGKQSSQIDTQMPMSMCLYLVLDDASTRVITSSDPGWKAAFNAPDHWYDDTFSDRLWKAAIPYSAPAASADDVTSINPVPTGPVVILRHTFQEAKPIVSARLYATALGAYKFHINGKEIGDQILAPGWMDFREHVPYQVYDVTANLKPGKNAIATFLAPGWYSTPLMWFRQSNNYGITPPAVKAQLRIEHSDGSVEWISTDRTWKADVSPILKAEIYDGETYDARRVQAGWDTATFGDAMWHAASLVVPREPQLVSQYFPPIRQEMVLTAKAITSPSAGVFIFDFGQNLSGVPRVRVTGKRGDDIKLRFAEVLNPDGTMYVDNLRTAKATDHFVLAGGNLRGASESYQPQFTYHGYRYIEISGLAERPSLDAVKTVVLHTDAPFTNHLESGDAMVNKLWSNIVWGQRSNFVGVPTDCPQRDERLGWTADAQVFWRTASYNMDLDAFTRKFSSDLRGTQVGTNMYGIIAPGTANPNEGVAAAWSDAGVIIPWTGWIQTGDKQIIDDNWDAMEKYLATIQSSNSNYLWRKNFGTAFGDWLTPTKTTPEDLIATAYWAYDVSLMRQMASATGRTQKAAEYSDLFEKIKAAFIKAYVRADGFVGTVDHYPSIPPPSIALEAPHATGAKQVVETQTGYVLALYFDLLPKELRARAADKLVQMIKENHWLLGTGFLGTPYLLEVLSDSGHSDVAYRLLLNRTYPSWGYLIDHGATTTWERWNGDKMHDDPSMNSYNHYAYGAVAAWMYRYAAGIDSLSADPGFHTIYLHPNFDSRLGSLSVSYQSPYGTIRSDWKTKDSTAIWNLTIPPNATAVLPVDATNASAFILDGTPIAQSGRVLAEGVSTFRLPSGNYSFNVSLKEKSETSTINGSLRD